MDHIFGHFCLSCQGFFAFMRSDVTTPLVGHTCLMTKKTQSQPDDEGEKLDIEALNALVERVNHFIDASPELRSANQAEKAKAIGMTDQKAFSRLINKRNALTLTTVDRIANKIGVPAWRLVMPLALDDGLKALGFPLDKLVESSSKKSMDHQVVKQRKAV